MSLVAAVHAGYIAQLSLVDNTEARVAPASCTADDMYTDCTVLFSSAKAHFTKENKNMFAFQTFTEARVFSTGAHRLVYYCPVHKYNWAKHSVCTKSLNEKAVAHSMLLGSKKNQKRRCPYFSILRGH